jgi:hypothetical protein
MELFDEITKKHYNISLTDTIPFEKYFSKRSIISDTIDENDSTLIFTIRGIKFKFAYMSSMFYIFKQLTLEQLKYVFILYADVFKDNIKFTVDEKEFKFNEDGCIEDQCIELIKYISLILHSESDSLHEIKCEYLSYSYTLRTKNGEFDECISLDCSLIFYFIVAWLLSVDHVIYMLI